MQLIAISNRWTHSWLGFISRICLLSWISIAFLVSIRRESLFPFLQRHLTTWIIQTALQSRDQRRLFISLETVTQRSKAALIERLLSSLLFERWTHESETPFRQTLSWSLAVKTNKHRRTLEMSVPFSFQIRQERLVGLVLPPSWKFWMKLREDRWAGLSSCNECEVSSSTRGSTRCRSSLQAVWSMWGTNSGLYLLRQQGVEEWVLCWKNVWLVPILTNWRWVVSNLMILC